MTPSHNSIMCLWPRQLSYPAEGKTRHAALRQVHDL